MGPCGLARGDQGHENALEDGKSATEFHLEAFGPKSLEVEEPFLEAFVTGAAV